MKVRKEDTLTRRLPDYGRTSSRTDDVLASLALYALARCLSTTTREEEQEKKTPARYERIIVTTLPYVR